MENKNRLAILKEKGPGTLTNIDLLIIALGDECAEEIKTLFASRDVLEVVGLFENSPNSVPGVRESTMIRLRAVRLVREMFFGTGP